MQLPGLEVIELGSLSDIMTRSKPLKGINERKNETSTTDDDHLEGTSARTRPLSFDDIMLARKTKMNATKQGFIGPVVTDIALTPDGQTSSPEGHKHPNEDSGSKDNRHTVEDSRRSNSLGKGGANASRESKSFALNKGKESRDHYPKLKSVVDKNINNDRVRDVRDKRRHHSHREKFTKEKDVFLSDHSDNESDRRQSRRSFKKEKGSETSRGKFEMDRKQLHNEGRQVSRKRKADGSTTSDSEYKKRSERDLMLTEKSTDRDKDKTEKEVRHKHHHEEARGRSTGEKHGSKKKGLDLTRAYHGESRSKRMRSQSREQAKEKGERSISQSPKAHKQKTRDKTEHGEILLNTTKDRSEKETSDVDKRISSNGTNNQYRRNNTSSSGLGGYSPRKRKTDAAAKTPSPTHRSPARRAAGWDLQPVEKESASVASTFPDAHTSQNISMNIQESPSGTPVAPTVIKPLGIFPHTFSSHMHAIESIQLTQATRPMRRLYVENLPSSASEKDLIECINQFLLSSGVNYIQGTQPCISCIIHKEKGQALLEFLTPEDASAALSFDGISFSGSYLKLRRPKDYATISTGVPEKSAVAVDSVCDNVEDSPHKIFVGGIPRPISSKMLLEIARAFGPVKAFHYKFITDIREPCAFLEYADHSVTSKACAGLNGMKLGGKVVTAVFATPDAVLEDVGKPPFYGIPEHAKPLLQNPLAVIKLKNVLDPDSFSSLSESELEEIVEDIRIECSRFGTVKSINIAKPANSPGTIEAETQTDKLEPENWRSENEKMGESIKEAAALDQLELPDTVPMMESDCQVAENKPSCDSITGVSNQPADEEDSNLPKVVGDSLPDEVNVDILVKDETCTSPSDDANKFVNDPSVDEPAKVDEAGGSIPPIIKMDEKPSGEVELKSEENTMEGGNPVVSDTSEGNVVDSTKAENDKDLGNIFEPGCIFVEYRRAESACTAAHSLHGRLFDGRIVTVEYVRPDLYQMRFRK